MASATYRYACKAEGIKIQKGELRFGTLVTIKDHTGWKWKHWGCVTPRQIENIVQQIGGLEGLDLDEDLDILDGYDELEDWAKQKIKQALIDRHVADEDWKGEPELNRPGQKGINKRTPKKKKDEEADDEEPEASPVPKPKKSRAKKSKVKAESEDEAIDAEPVPKKKVTTRKRKAQPAEEDGDVTDEVPASKPKKRAKAGKAVKAEEPDEEQQSPIVKPKLAARSKKVKTEDSESEEPPAPVSKRAATKGRKVKTEDDESAPQVAKPVAAAKAKRATKSSGKKKIKAEEDEPVPDAEPEEEIMDAQIDGVSETEPPVTKKGTKSRRSKKNDAVSGEEAIQAIDPAGASKGGRGKKSKVKAEAVVEEPTPSDIPAAEDLEDDEGEQPAKKTKGRKRAGKVAA